MCTTLNAQAKASVAASSRRANTFCPRQRPQRKRYTSSPPRPKANTAANWPGFCSTPKLQLPLSVSCTGTTAKARVATISQPMPRAGASRSVSGASSAQAVMAQRMSTGI